MLGYCGDRSQRLTTIYLHLGMLSPTESPASGQLLSMRWSNLRLSAGNYAVYDSETQCVRRLSLQRIGQFARPYNAMSSEGKNTRILGVACVTVSAKVVLADKTAVKIRLTSSFIGSEQADANPVTSSRCLVSTLNAFVLSVHSNLPRG